MLEANTHVVTHHILRLLFSAVFLFLLTRLHCHVLQMTLLGVNDLTAVPAIAL